MVPSCWQVKRGTVPSTRMREGARALARAEGCDFYEAQNLWKASENSLEPTKQMWIEAESKSKWLVKWLIEGILGDEALAM